MKRLWWSFVGVLVVSFSILGWIGTRIYQQAPPIAARVVVDGGAQLLTAADIRGGQNVWQTMGGMELGSIWGHGSYVAPDWTADYLHREATFLLDKWAKADFGCIYADLPTERASQLLGRLEQVLRANRYDAASDTLTIDADRAEAFAANLAHYSEVFSQGEPRYALPKGAVTQPDRLRSLTAFFFWTAWAAVTNRPGDHVSYTQNWPYEPLVGNRPTGETLVWTGVSILMLLAGISGMIWWYASQSFGPPEEEPPREDPLRSWRPTASQRATLKYFWVVAALILVQMLLGVVTAHYGVEGDAFYGIPLSRWLPYSVSRTWHVQLGILWIATAWLAAGLFIGPLVSDTEPKGQRLGVNLLFVALLAVVVGSLAGQWLSIHNKLTDQVAFYFGHQGYEYVDLGRAWQIALFVGLLLWLVLVFRVVWPALQRGGDQKQLLVLLLVSTTAIALFYASGLAWGRRTHLSLVEYWRWWVVHLWVEGFFEVFATTVIAFFFMRLKLMRPRLAAAAALMSATIFLSGGIIGTCHHLYFSGTPTAALAWGAVFSALEVVPLVLVAYGAVDDYRRARASAWVARYKWPIYFFIAVAFWNMLGAGLFGFMINPPIALYYMQGLNTTPVHGHTALFGVYGMLGIGLMLICLRALEGNARWNERLLAFSFWAMNGGLLAMVLVSVLPVGLMQTWASVEQGYWYARSHEFLGTPLMQTLRWLRIPGDTLFALGAVTLACFVAHVSLQRGADSARSASP
jgi:nitric oxide reductase subunit B